MALRRWMLKHVAIHDVANEIPMEISEECTKSLEIHASWLQFLNLSPEQISTLIRITERVDRERRVNTIYPEKENVHRWSQLCFPHNVRVVIVGQDPYTDGSANGLAFGTTQDRPAPPSLVNVFKELRRSIPEFQVPQSGCLDMWCKEGVLLINSVFTVIKSRPGSHETFGWQLLSDRVLKTLSERKNGLVFMLWGLHAQRKEYLLDATKHLILKSSHPSPRAQGSKTPFVGNNHFVLANEYLNKRGEHVNWNVLTK
uniref:Uracil-DNA glycosylase n=1 Tax=Mastomys natalensis cytomegalovirus 1 TaxID=2973541 RepID=A0A9Y1IJJ7_9BETA|nr:uracil-DNA glycosylase [Mastomys natalensis cytomegalovirus 1]WEG68964.1 uracil-DNA glycosylase [Mastomys natalensis cytomegalovirus 1]WEG71192.1 uracil-DNA glycosylase [Mastomys natalensis cytomegalovirus 1]